MLLSREIEKRLGIKVTPIREVEVETLGLSVSSPKKSFGTFLVNSKYASGMNQDIKMVITTKEVAEELGEELTYGLCVVEEDPRLVYFKLHNALSKEDFYKGVDRENQIGDNCQIADFAVIAKKNVTIGNNVVIEDFVKIYENVTMGDNVIIRSGTTVGGVGFEMKNEDGKLFTVDHLGSVEIGDNVEIQNNCTIDRAIYPWDVTKIGSDIRIANLCYIAHGTKIGRGTMIAAGSIIAGRVVIGEYSWIGLGAVIRNGISIGNRSRVNMGAVVTLSVKDNEAVSGNFATNHEEFIQRLRESKR